MGKPASYIIYKNNYTEEILERLQSSPAIIDSAYPEYKLLYVPKGAKLDYILEHKSKGILTLGDVLNCDKKDYVKVRFEPDSIFICDGEIVKGVIFELGNPYKDDRRAIALDFKGNKYSKLYNGCYETTYKEADKRLAAICDNYEYMEAFGKTAKYIGDKFVDVSTEYTTDFIVVYGNNIHQVDKYGILQNTISFNRDFKNDKLYVIPECVRYGKVIKGNYGFYIWDKKFYNNEDLLREPLKLGLDDCYYNGEYFNLAVTIVSVNHFIVNIYKDGDLYRNINIENVNNKNIVKIIKDTMIPDELKTPRHIILDMFDRI